MSVSASRCQGAIRDHRLKADDSIAWPQFELGEICTLEYGKSLPAPARSRGNVPVYGSNGVVGQHDKPLTSGPTVVIGRKGSIGKVHYSPVPCFPIDTAYFVASRGPKLYDELWLTYALQQLDLAQLNEATGVPGLSRDAVYALRLTIPPLAEQERIAARLTIELELVERARTAAAQRLAAAEALPASLLREVFEGPEASGWMNRTIGEFASTCSGATPSRGNSAYFGGAIPWVKTGELRDGFVGDDGSTEESVTEAALRDCSLPLLPPGTLLIAMYGQGKTRGRTGILTREATTNQACFAILPAPDVFDTGFLQLWFRANYNVLRSMTENRGGNQPNLNGVLLRDLKVPLPDPAAQSRLAADLRERLTAADGVIAWCRQELADIEALPAALLRAAVNGAS